MNEPVLEDKLGKHLEDNHSNFENRNACPFQVPVTQSISMQVRILPVPIWVIPKGDNDEEVFLDSQDCSLLHLDRDRFTWGSAWYQGTGLG